MSKLNMRRMSGPTRSNMMILDAQGPLRLLKPFSHRPKMWCTARLLGALGLRSAGAFCILNHQSNRRKRIQITIDV
eukprot:8821664-Pyramimonas_sp.AAC.1